MDQEEAGRGKVISELTSQEETLKMARYFARRELSTLETVLGVIAAAIFYGVGIGFGLYLLVAMFL